MATLLLIAVLLARLAALAGPGFAGLVQAECQGFAPAAIINELQDDLAAYQQGYSFNLSTGHWLPEYPDFFTERGCI